MPPITDPSDIATELADRLPGSVALWGAVAVLLAGLLALGLGALALTAYYDNRVYPGVRVGDVALGGLTGAEAERRLRDALREPDAEITLRDPINARTWTRSAAELGLTPDPTPAVAAALDVGRIAPGLVDRWGARWQAWRSGTVITETVLFDAQRARETLEALAPEVDTPPRDARIERRGGEIVAVEAELGHQLDVAGTLAALAAAPLSSAQEVELAVARTAPRRFDLSNVAGAYQRITSAPVQLVLPSGPREIPVSLLEQWTAIEERPPSPGAAPEPSVVFDRDAVRAWLAPLADELRRPPRNARFVLDEAAGGFRLLRSAQTGLTLDVEQTVTRIIEFAYAETRIVEPAVEIERPAVPNAALGALGDVTEIGYAATDVAGSPSGRLENLLLAAERLNGVTLQPGGTFSFNDAIGPVDADHGFNAAFLAPLGTGPGLGDAIDQVATTAFRAAFWSGLPITERHAPPRRIGWLEPPVGLDAGVAPPARDLRLVNDRQDYLVMLVALDAKRQALTWTLFGAREENTVTVETMEVSGLVPPPPPETHTFAGLASGQRIQVRWAREGAEAVVERAVVGPDGTERLRDTFTSRYDPTPDVVLVGP